MVTVTYDTPKGKAFWAHFNTIDEALTSVLANPPKVDGAYTNVYLVADIDAPIDVPVEGIDWVDQGPDYEPVAGGMTPAQIEDHERQSLRY